MIRPVLASRRSIGGTMATGSRSGGPPVLTGLQFWADASDISSLWQDNGRSIPVTADDQTVGSCDDKSGNGRHATQATPGSRPTYKTAIKNGLSVLRFDGTADNLRTANWSLVQPTHIFAVGRFNAVTDFFLDGILTNSGSLVSLTATTLRLYAGVALNNTNLVLGNYHLFTAQINGASSSNQIDGGSPATGNAGATNMGGITIGASGSITLFLAGDVCEILIYSGLLNSSEEAATQAYLNSKWAIY